ncbi:unnamed protein product [marine sediment metagenome]|uniref:Uncharacterized protein n=1 Tax=marine sediment metagenome TaxID=412755 RepID=X1R144_9ZZZZ
MEGVKYDDKFLLVFWDKMRYFKAHYIYPSQETLLKWLRNQGGLGVSRRTLNRYLRELQNRQIIGRIRRIRHDPLKGMQFATTLYSIGLLGLRKLVMLGVITWEQFRLYIKNSNPFRIREPKKNRKGLRNHNNGFYKTAKKLGDLFKNPH